MKTRPGKHRGFTPPLIEGEMCGRCAFWHLQGDDELGECSVLAVSHRRGELVKRKRVIPDVSDMGPLKRMVVSRTLEADDGYELRQEGGGEVVPAENFSSIPREFVDMNGEKQKVWSPLRTYEWGGCTRWEEGEQQVFATLEPQPMHPSAPAQLSLFGDAA